MKKKYKKLLIILGSTVLVLGIAFAIFLYLMFYPPIPEADDKRIEIAAIGDSNTFGAGVIFDSRDKNSYPAQLQTMLGTKYQVLNYGLSARTLLKSGNMPYWGTTHFNSSRKVNPAIVLIMLGTNDTKSKNWNANAYEIQLKEFVSSYQTLSSHPTVYLLTPPAAYPNNYDISPIIIADEVVPIIRRVAKQLTVPVIDVFSATSGHAEYFPDGVHPGAYGYRLMAETVYTALRNNNKEN